MEKRFQMRMPITAGLHTIAVAFIKKSSATTLELLQPFGRERIDPITPVGIPELDKVTIEGPFKPAATSASSPSRRKIFTCQPARHARRRRLRREDPDHAGAARLPRAGERGGNDAPDRLLRRGARGRAGASTTASRPRCGSCW